MYTNDINKTPIFGYNEPIGFETVTVADTAVTLTANTYSVANRAYITTEDASFRFTVDGTTPTASIGHLVTTGSNLELNLHAEIVNFKAIRTGSTSVSISVTYYV